MDSVANFAAHSRELEIRDSRIQELEVEVHKLKLQQAQTKTHHHRAQDELMDSEFELHEENTALKKQVDV